MIGLLRLLVAFWPRRAVDLSGVTFTEDEVLEELSLPLGDRAFLDSVGVRW